MKQLQVMNFLNEIATVFPNAISLAAGRPNPKFFNESDWEKYRTIFISYYAEKNKCSLSDARKKLCEYGPSAGIIRELLQKHVQVDEGVKASLDNIIVTNGCQEALAIICIDALKDDNDCVLTIDPSYVGFSGLLESMGKKIEAIDVSKLCSLNENGLMVSFDWQHLRDRVSELKKNGLNPKIIYTNFDFNNPLTYCLSYQDRIDFLAFCSELELKVIEDNPYSYLNYTENTISTLRSLDRYDIVYYIGSFSKTLCPGLRVGYLIVPETKHKEAELFVSIKSFLTVNTSSLTQSVVGGFLIEHDFSLISHMKPIALGYKSQRDALVNALEYYFFGVQGVSWNIPDGGMFLVMELPFAITEEDVFKCAKEENVIFMPVSFFSLRPSFWSHRVRLSFSYYEADVLYKSIEGFSRYVRKRIGVCLDN